MNEILLSFHVVSGILAIVSSLNRLVPVLAKLKSLFWPSVSAVSATGLGLSFTGVSLARVCVSGVVIIIILLVIHKFSAQKLATTRTNHNQ